MKTNFFGINKELEVLGARALKMASERFREIEENAQYNSEKVLAAFIDNKVSESHFTASTGYGYGDRGREVLDSVLAQIFGCEDALIRYNFMSGTHAIATALFGLLRPGDTMVCLTGTPYDTLHGVIGLSGEPGCGSLKDFGIHYRQLELTPEGKVDLEAIPAAVRDAKVAYIQRSRGYSLRDSLFVADIEKIVAQVRKGNPSAIVLVDNCYGEFVEQQEPTQVGADVMVGSLIQNPRGGRAPTGGYVDGRHDLVELCAQRLTAPGVGREIGCTLGNNRSLFMGLFFAPTVVAAALKTATFAAALFELLRYEVTPRYCEPRADIIQAIKLREPAALIAFCQGVQKGAPVDSYVTPEPWDMPGYDSQVIMAAGAFTNGASIELSADAPLREPYAVWMQGGLTFESGRVGVLLAAQTLLDKGIISL